MTELVIDVRDLRKNFGTHRVVHGLNLQVASGEVTGQVSEPFRLEDELAVKLVAALDNVLCHGTAHDAQTDEPYFHDSFPCCERCAGAAENEIRTRTVGLPVVCVETRHIDAVLRTRISKTDRKDAVPVRFQWLGKVVSLTFFILWSFHRRLGRRLGEPLRGRGVTIPLHRS